MERAIGEKKRKEASPAARFPSSPTIQPSATRGGIRHLVTKLQNGLDVYTQYLTDWKIRVNAEKTQAIPHPNTERLKPTTKLKVLGSEVDWSQVDDRIIKGIAMLKKLYPIINRRSKATLKNKLAIYNMLYGSPV
ncbi:hypothetical protein pipiens_006739 [Culex pipiens pipiens]|uniref:Reverse transcriptase n=1 Tax=Culex pipiens pipiens TaxID=38569 RepID=A0ABD1DNE7_CULPP